MRASLLRRISELHERNARKRVTDQEKNKVATRERNEKRKKEFAKLCLSPEKQKAARKQIKLDHQIWLWQREKREREKARWNARKWARNNPEKAKVIRKAASARRRARLLSAPGRFYSYHVDIKLQEQGGRCANPHCRCELTEFHADHVIPLARGGSNSASNIQLLCPSCNLKKGAKSMEEFLKSYLREVRFARGY